MQEPPDLRRGRDPAGRRAVVPRACARQGHGTDPAPAQGAAVLDAEDIVRFSEKCRVRLAEQLRHRAFAADGERVPAREPTLQCRAEVLAVETCRNAHKRCRVAALRAEGPLRHNARPPQQRNPAARKALRRRHGPDRRQLKHHVRPAAQRHLRAGALFGDGGLAPLDEVAAHDAHHG